MSEFELRRQLQELRRGRVPEVDLWPAIAARIGAQPRAPARSAFAAGRWALAAGLSLAVGLGLVLEHRHERAFAAARDRVERERAAQWVAGQVRSLDGAYAGALDDLRSHTRQTTTAVSPGLYAAAAQLDAAEAQLKQSLAAEPRATYLIEMLGRTQAKRLELEKLKRTS